MTNPCNQNFGDRKYSDLVPVRHKTAGYCGWIFDVTRMKERFTGNMDVEWQYRIWTATGVKIAPEEDLDLDPCPPKRLPPDLLAKFSSGGTADSSELFLLGYQLTDLSQEARLDILLYSAIPALGLVATVRVLCGIIYRKLKTRTWEKYRYAFKEWQSDLDVLLTAHDFKGSEYPSDLLQFIVLIKRKLEAGGVAGRIKSDDILAFLQNKKGETPSA